MSTRKPPASILIWLYAIGYFACYVPYSALTKEISLGRMPSMTRPMSGFALLPVVTFASLVGMMIFLTATRFFRHAGHRTVLGRRIPVPGRWTFLSGLATAAIIGTTTLAYTFDGLSIVFMMLLMRGGVLVLAPIVDKASGRRVTHRSWIALALSLAALGVTMVDAKGLALTVTAAIDVGVYLLSYFVRLRFMSKLAKSEDRDASLRFFVEEQMVATPAIFLALVLAAIVGVGDVMETIRSGFVDAWSSGVLLPGLVVGVLSQGTGIFGGLILLDHRENAFSVPVNRASSVLAGVVAAAGLALIGAGAPPPPSELVGAAIVVAAVVVLAAPRRATATAA